MISLFRSIFRSRKNSSAELIAAFLRQPEHAWILRDEPFRNGLIELFCSFPVSDLRHLFEKERLLLLYCNQRMSAALYPYEGRAVILVFPELHQLMSSAQFLQAHAVLAHELGHVFHRHARIRIGSLQAQLEADRYAWDRGLGEELIAVLRAEADAPETRRRLEVLEALESRALSA